MPENANPQSAAPNPSTATETLPASPPINPMSELFAGLEKLGVNGHEEKPVKPEPKKEAAPKSPPSSKPAQTASKSSPKSDSSKTDAESKSANPATKTEEKKPSEAPKTSSTEKPVPAPELRKAYEELKAKHKALEEEHKAWKTREDPEKKTLAEKAEAAAKRAKELEDKLRFTDYQSSDEYKEKYYKPFEEAYMSAVQKAASFKVTDTEGNTRQATKADFDRVVMAGDEESALNAAIEIFGETKAPFIMMQRDNVLTHNARMLKAVEDFKKTAGERSQAELAKSQERSKKMEALYQQHLAEAKEQFPHYFTEEEGDEEGNNLLKRGYSKYEAVFNGGHALDKDGNPIDLTDEQLVELHAEVFNKAAGFNRLAMKLTKASSRIKELEEELAQFQSSEPKQGEGEPEKEEGEPSWEQALESYAIR